MGILNVTPDSFYDGGQFDAEEKAYERALEMINEGADIIDIGGESTGPGSGEVSVEEELGKVIPILERVQKWKVESGKSLSSFLFPLSSSHSPLCSVDTYKATAAQESLKAGAAIINDVTAGRGDPEMFNVIAKTGCKYVMMHSKDNSPRTTINEVEYDDVLKTIHEFFEVRIAEAEKCGIKREQLILDPGLGHFVSSDPKYSWQILENLEFLQNFGCPILVSPSRKSFTAENPDQPPEGRLEGTLRATRMAVEHGASIVRTHDVSQTVKMIGGRKLE